MVANPPVVVLQNALSEELSNMKKLQDDLLANKVTPPDPSDPPLLQTFCVFGFSQSLCVSLSPSRTS